MSTVLRRRVWHLWPVLGIVVIFSYNTWLLWRPLNGDRMIFDGYLSELSASDQPHNLFFRTGDLVTALIVATMGFRAGVLWSRRHPHRPRWWLVAAAGLVVFGLATIFDAVFALDCSPTLSSACKVAEEAGRLSLVHYVHTFTSVAAQIGIVASMIATYVALRRTGRSTSRHWVLCVALAEVVALSVMMIMLVLRLPGLAYPQAVMVGLASLWFAAIGFGLMDDEARDAGDTGSEEVSDDQLVR
jgi:hypothetical protein